jgi:hypothetical protein
MNNSDASTFSLNGKWLGLTSFFITIAFFAISLSVFIGGGSSFNPANMYISDLGDVQGWTSVVYSSGMLLVTPLRFLFLLYVLGVFSRWGAPRAARIVLLCLGVITNLGIAGMAAVNYDLSLAVHMGCAFAYFFSSLISQIIICAVELRRVGKSRILWISSAANVVAGLFFVMALTVSRFVPSLPRVLSTLSEWILLVALMTWLVIHSLRLGVAESQKKRPDNDLLA